MRPAYCVGFETTGVDNAEWPDAGFASNRVGQDRLLSTEVPLGYRTTQEVRGQKVFYLNEMWIMAGQTVSKVRVNTNAALFHDRRLHALWYEAVIV